MRTKRFAWGSYYVPEQSAMTLRRLLSLLIYFFFRGDRGKEVLKNMQYKIPKEIRQWKGNGGMLEHRLVRINVDLRDRRTGQDDGRLTNEEYV